MKDYILWTFLLCSTYFNVSSFAKLCELHLLRIVRFQAKESMCKRYRRTKGKSYLYFLFVVIINTRFLFVFDLLKFLKINTISIDFEEFSLSLHLDFGGIVSMSLCVELS